MRTGLNKRQKVTEIYFDEHSPIIEVYTNNTDLKNRLVSYAESYSQHYRQTDDDGQGGLRFEIEKGGRFSFRLTAPYSEERRQAASEYAKEHGIAARGE